MIPRSCRPGRCSGTALPRLFALLVLLFVPALNLFPASEFKEQEGAEKLPPGISRKASSSCDKKVKALEAHAVRPKPRKKQTTRFSQEEINSYLALELKDEYHPSLRSLEFTIEDDKLKAVASIDFDKLGMNSQKVLTRMVARLFSGVHRLSVQGKLASGSGKANFVLDEARFDNNVIPNFLVEEIISAVGRKQRPPFDPMQPSQMPYAIDRVDFRRGQITVYQ